MTDKNRNDKDEAKEEYDPAGSSLSDLVKEKSKDDSSLTAFEKKILEQEKRIKEGKPSSSNKLNGLPVREKRKTSAEEKNPIKKNTPWAIITMVICLLAMGALLAWIVFSDGELPSIEEESESAVEVDSESEVDTGTEIGEEDQDD